MKSKRVIIAGGKTGGHLFPGIAVAQALTRTDPGTKILFVGTDAPFEVDTLSRYGFAHRAILSRPVKGGSLPGKAWAAALVGVSIIQALYIILRFRADFILGVGGFSSFALVVAGRMLGRRTAIQEQNAIPGMTNRLLSKIAHTLFISFEQTRGMPVNHRTILSGNPMRENPDTGQNGTSVIDRVGPKDFLILVTGGSQGAASVNRAVTAAVEKMKHRQDLFIIHQTGQASETEIRAWYAAQGIRAEVRAFFHDMPAIQDRADLIIARAGAGTLSELAVKAKPAILVPYPHAADDHQTANARNLADKGAALMIPDKDLTGDALRDRIEDLMDNPEKRDQMARAMADLARPNGARIIAGHILGHKAVKGEN